MDINKKELEELEKLVKEAVKSEEGWEEVHIEEVVLINEDKVIRVKPHYRNINGKKVYVKAHYRRKPKHGKKTKS